MIGFNIELKNISFAYEGSPLLVKDINLSAKAGEIVVISADTGSGKSTLIKICAGLLEPIKGELIINEKNFWGLNIREQNQIRRKMGLDFQEAALITNMTIKGNLELPLRYHGDIPENKVSPLVDEWLSKCEIENYKNMLPAALSTGLRRRVSFIRAVLSGKNFLFFDDPTQGREDGFLERIVETILEKKENRISSIITTKDKSLIEKVADRVVIFKDGKIC